MERFVRWLTGEEIEEQTERRPAAAAPEPDDRSPRQAVHATGLPPVENNAAGYGVTIEEADVAPGAEYWRVVRIYHLASHENKGRHHIFLDAVSPQGTRLRDSRAHITWAGGEQTVTLDKPDDEPGANFPMWKWQECSVRMLDLPSDTVHGLRTDHPDEPAPDGTQGGNTLFHHSFFVIFQQVTAPEAMGTIRGRVANSQEGFSAELWRDGHIVDTAAVGADGSFTFPAVQPGEVEVRVAEQRQTVVVAGDETVQFVFSLPARDSVLEGVVHNAGGLILRLVLDGDVLAEGQLGKSGTFRLRNLAPGTYFIQVLRPGSIDPLVQSGPQEMDGANLRRVELTVPAPAQEITGSPFSHYVLLGAPDRATTRAHLTLLAPVLAQKRLAFGFDMQEATHAGRVTVVGDGEAVPESTLIYLIQHGVKVQRLAGTLQEILDQLRE